jgi:putative oxidoreductase
VALEGVSRIAPLPLRIAAGATLCAAGAQKLFVHDIQTFVDAVRPFGLPYGEVLAHVAAWGEFAGGILLVIGLATRLAALVNAGTMFVAVWKAHLAGAALPQALWEKLVAPDGYALPLVLLACCIALVLTGAGALSIDGAFARRHSKALPEAE